MISRRNRWGGILIVVALTCAAGIAIPAIRRSILRTAGCALVVDEEVEPADIIVVALGADGAGVLEATDLVHSGVAKRVAVFVEPPNDPVSSEFARRRIPYEDAAARSVRQLKALGVEAIEPIPTYVTGSEDEGPVLADWCTQRQLQSVVVVSASDHSRRLRRVFHRSMQGNQTKVIVRSARYSEFDPNRWWETRSGIRTEAEELEKLVLDIVSHPFS